MSDKNRRLLVIWVSVGGVLIFILVVVLIAILVPKDQIPENAFRADKALIEGEEMNAETLAKWNALVEKEPVLAALPLTVEYYADDYSAYTKYILSYGLDFESERGFYLIMKDYTNAGMFAGISKLTEMGMNTVGVELRYEDLSGESLSPRAEDS